jgi:hypothetical protein
LNDEDRLDASSAEDELDPDDDNDGVLDKDETMGRKDD